MSQKLFHHEKPMKNTACMRIRVRKDDYERLSKMGDMRTSFADAVHQLIVLYDEKSQQQKEEESS